MNSWCYFVQKYLNSAWYNNAPLIIVTPYLTIIVSNTHGPIQTYSPPPVTSRTDRQIDRHDWKLTYEAGNKHCNDKCNTKWYVTSNYVQRPIMYNAKFYSGVEFPFELIGQTYIVLFAESVTDFYRPQLSWGKVMFLQVCVILFTVGGVQVHPPTRYTPWDQVHPPGPGAPLRTRYTPLDQVHPPDQVTPGPGTHPNPGTTEIRSTRGRYASYWNAIQVKARSYGAFLCLRLRIYLHVIWWKFSHGAMGVDAICYVYILESHIAIAQNTSPFVKSYVNKSQLQT